VNELARRQLDALGEVAAGLERDGVEYALFGGWAVDFHARRATRAHDDVDLVVWRDDRERIVAMLEQRGWRHAPVSDEDGGTGYERDGVRVELTFLALVDGVASISLRQGAFAWPDALRADVLQLDGVTARVQALEVLRRTKLHVRDDDESDAHKDRVDFEVLDGLA
jgi:hypothetical protein